MTNSGTQSTKIVTTLVVVLLVLCFATFAWLIVDIESLKRSGEFSRTNMPWRHNSAAIPHPDTIQEWMTFAYINYIYHLPPTYLQTKLSVSSERYPQLQVTSYAAEKNISTQEALNQIKQVISNFEQP